MNRQEITRLAQERGYCELKGRTPDATISAAMETEMKRKGKDSRFTKV
ncbi:MAG: winged helix-turn-helix domain-containing protein, partial [Planctomycetaceae bacterium]|nr:winged helix-turn-helix domain-containing protein [Planctomycetaceae bacterium]